MAASNIYPTFPLRAVRHTGVYVPAIKTEIIIWSILRKIIVFLRSKTTEWYVVLAAYNNVVDTIKTNIDIEVKKLPCSTVL